jgi:hypothetical protein
MYLVDGGCLILSRARIVSTSVTVFPSGVMSDRMAAKGCIYAKLNPRPGVYIHLFVTHLQAVYAGSDEEPCLSAQREQYSYLVDFIATTVAENETHTDMLEARRLTVKKNSGIDPDIPAQAAFEKCRRWPVILTGDFNCNSRGQGRSPAEHSAIYADLSRELAKIGPFNDACYDRMGEHPVTYAAADVDIDGAFSPREIRLTHPDDYHESGAYVNQCLDYLFTFPPTYELPPTVSIGHPIGARDGEMSPDSRKIRQCALTVSNCSVRHLEYKPIPNRPAPGLQYLSDHLAIETSIDLSDEI